MTRGIFAAHGRRGRRHARAVCAARIGGRLAGMHLLGTSGTVTTVAGIHLGLPRYDRRLVDGLWMSDADVTAPCDGCSA